MDRLYLWLHSQSDGHGLVTGLHQPIPYGLVTTWHCGDMTRMALDMYTILPAPPTINFNLVDWQAQDAISAPTQIVITLQLINHLGTKYQ